jgi:hypothetical protein
MTTELHITGHPKSVIGTPAYTGPYSRLRGDHPLWVEQGRRAWEMTIVGPYSVREAAAALGMSTTTTWRRAWWFHDWLVLPRLYGLEPGPVPHQRGTRAVPNGRPISLPMDAHSVFRQLLDAGVTVETIAASWRTIPVCIRNLAIGRMVRERLDEGGRAWLDEESNRRRDHLLTKW